MSAYEKDTYGEIWAPHYDSIFSEVEDSVIDLLHEYSGASSRALELAVGTGRIALPLARRGVQVTGIDISEGMVGKLREKAGGAAIDVVMGDFAEVGVEGTYPLVYLAFNTLFALLTQERQVQCFGNVAAHLERGGRFVLDCFVPNLKRFDEYNTRMGVSSISSNEEHAYEMSIHEPATQRITTHMIRRRADGSDLVLPVEIRYAWPAEMDLMAALAGLELEHRWGWYDRRPFTGASTSHLSVYRRPV